MNLATTLYAAMSFTVGYFILLSPEQIDVFTRIISYVAFVLLPMIDKATCET